MAAACPSPSPSMSTQRRVHHRARHGHDRQLHRQRQLRHDRRRPERPDRDVNLGNTIVAGNSASSSGPDASGTFASQGHNLVGKTDGSIGWVGSDLTGTIAQPLNPLLAPLGELRRAGPDHGPARRQPGHRRGEQLHLRPHHSPHRPARCPARRRPGSTPALSSISAPTRPARRTWSRPPSTPWRSARSARRSAGPTSAPTPTRPISPIPRPTRLSSTPRERSPRRRPSRSLPGLGTLELTGTGTAESIIGTAAGVTISGGDAVRVFQVDNGVTATLSGLTITGGSTTGDGGGLYDDGGTLTLTGVTVAGNTAAAGGGLFLARVRHSTPARWASRNAPRSRSSTAPSAATPRLPAADSIIPPRPICLPARSPTTPRLWAVESITRPAATPRSKIRSSPPTSIPGGSPSDIGGGNAAGVAGTYDLAGHRRQRRARRRHR